MEYTDPGGMSIALHPPFPVGYALPGQAGAAGPRTGHFPVDSAGPRRYIL